MRTWPRVTPFGEFAFLVELGDTFDDALAARAQAIADRWDLGPGIPAYTSVVLSIDASVDADRTTAADGGLTGGGPCAGATRRDPYAL